MFATYPSLAGRVVLINPRGTVWNGASGVVFASGAGGGDAISLPGSLAWKLRPSWGGLSATLDLSCCTAKPIGLRASPGVKGLQLRLLVAGRRAVDAVLNELGFRLRRPLGRRQRQGNGQRQGEGEQVAMVHKTLLFDDRRQTAALGL